MPLNAALCCLILSDADCCLRLLIFAIKLLLAIFVFGKICYSEQYSYSHSDDFFKPNTIRIRIRSFLKGRIVFVFVFGLQNTIRSPLASSHFHSLDKRVFSSILVFNISCTAPEVSEQCFEDRIRIRIIFVKKFLPNTNMNIIRQKISTEYEYEYYLV